MVLSTNITRRMISQQTETIIKQAIIFAVPIELLLQIKKRQRTVQFDFPNACTSRTRLSHVNTCCESYPIIRICCVLPGHRICHSEWLSAGQNSSQSRRRQQAGGAMLRASALIVSLLSSQSQSSLAHSNGSDFCTLLLRCHRRPQKVLAIAKTRQGNAALRFRGAMESRQRFAILCCDFQLQSPSLLQNFW